MNDETISRPTEPSVCGFLNNGHQKHHSLLWGGGRALVLWSLGTGAVSEAGRSHHGAVRDLHVSGGMAAGPHRLECHGNGASPEENALRVLLPKVLNFLLADHA